jgi:hypothetical protein
MKQAFALASAALLAFAASWFALAAMRPASPASAQSPESPSSSVAEEPDRLADRMTARLDEIGQVRDDLDDQKTAVAKAELALATARRDAEVADLAAREYDEGTFPQELALAEGELALAEAEYRLQDDPSRRSDPPPKPGEPEAKPTGTSDAPALARARLTRDLARAHRDTLARLTRPRRKAELQKEVERARGERKLKEAALDQERADLTRLEHQLKAAALSPEEKQAMALLGEAAKEASGDPSPAALDRASALWARAERLRAEAKRAEARDRVRKALKKGD